MTVTATSVVAQDGDRPIGFGPAAGMQFEGSLPFIGAALRVGTPLMVAENELMFDGGFEFYLDTPSQTLIGIQAAMLLPLLLQGSQVTPVFGAGLAFLNSSFDSPGLSSNSDLFLSLIGGIMVRAFFADLALRVGSNSTLVARLGFLGIGNIL